MAFSKDISSYPAWMMAVAQYFAEGGETFEEPCATKGEAVNARQQFYAFRKLLRDQGGDVATGVAGVTVTIVGEKILRFQSVDSLGINQRILARIEALRAEQGGSAHPLRRATDSALSGADNTSDEITAVGRMDDPATKAIEGFFGVRE